MGHATVRHRVPVQLLFAVALIAIILAAPKNGDVLHVYNNGTLNSNWTSASFGSKVNFQDSSAAFKDSEYALTAETFPFAAFILASDPAFNAKDKVFDAWVRGNALTRSSFHLQDSNGRRLSKFVPLAFISTASENASVDAAAARLLGPDAAGWYRLQVNLGQLVKAAAVPLKGRNPNSWDRIVFQDISGNGFNLTIGSADLVSGLRKANGTTTADVTGCVGATCNPILSAASVESDLVPLYGGDASAASVDGAPSNVIARLVPGITVGEVAALCAELAGTLDTAEKQARFRGSCKLDVAPQEGAAVADIEAPVEWPFLSISAESEADLRAMRASLQDSVSYFDRDGIATISMDVSSANALNTNGKGNGGGNRRILQEIETDLSALAAAAEAAASTPVPAPEGETAATDGNNASVAASCTTPWSLDRIDQSTLPLDGKFQPGYTGAGVHIYSLDTGVRVTHQDFSGRIGQSANCASGGNTICRTDLPVTDNNGHGTHVAGTAAGTCYGVAKGATINPVKVMGDDGSGSYSNIIAGMKWVQQDVAKNGWPAVVSMSLGGDASKSLDDAVAEVVAAGIPVVVAAGNEFGADACTRSPSAATSAITVASTDREDKASPFSNIGPCVDIWAPGSQVVSASYSDDTSSRPLSGTSMATPAVAGAVALALQARPGSSPQTIMDILSAAGIQKNFVSGTTPLFLQTTSSGLAG